MKRSLYSLIILLGIQYLHAEQITIQKYTDEKYTTNEQEILSRRESLLDKRRQFEDIRDHRDKQRTIRAKALYKRVNTTPYR